ncbi:MAG: SGNH/GDSL hydrolase family protein [Cyanobacteria bacterium]|nr:SGNH/GDSL hydrolase family protein [Cyanobacteriota bacterium]
MRRAKILAVQLIIRVLLLEALLRVYHPLPFVLHGNAIDLRVGLQYRRKNPPDPRVDPITVATRNSLGFRGAEPPADIGRRLTIAAVGGSTTENSILSDRRTWPELLGVRLAATHPDTWVYNAGFNGHSTAGHLVLLRAVLVKIKPSMMLVLAGVNDIGMPDDGAAEFDPDNTNRPWSDMARHSQIMNSLLNLYRAWRASRLAIAGDDLVDFARLPQRDMTDAEISAAIAPFTAQVAGYDRRLTALATEARRAGIAPVFITQPLLAGDAVDPATGLDLRRLVEHGELNGLAQWRLLEIYNDVMRANAAAHAVPLIDLARQLPKDTRYYCDFMHFSNAGAAAVADIVAAGLQPYLVR